MPLLYLGLAPIACSDQEAHSRGDPWANALGLKLLKDASPGTVRYQGTINNVRIEIWITGQS